MVRDNSLARTRYIYAALVAFGLGSVLISGCQPKQQARETLSSPEREEISQLKIRIKNIELQNKKIISQLKKTDQIDSPGPIRSITFRNGTRDDRLRIYWADGSKTDLPCTKEQSIWACG